MVHIVGSDDLPEHVQQVMMTARLPVMFHGYLSDDELASLYMAVKVSVAPLLSGAGVKGKVNQAMNYGVPVVATRIAVEGMHVEDGRDCMVADNLESFAKKLVQVYTDCELWSHLVRGGYDNLNRYFSYETARQQLIEALTEVGRGPREPAARLTCAADSEET